MVGSEESVGGEIEGIYMLWVVELDLLVWNHWKK
jgi:hypothetical protein